ncbi:DUF3297 family protein [Leucobacter insecticola]|uniref:DUF3297 family protein n=1 Tax=Leucobacter insecticola TaxID=2714934 RepID=A0A6G8FJU5_9MICO|nr:DUF3297 family protein [Leucobacter insecticola]
MFDWVRVEVSCTHDRTGNPLTEACHRICA